MSSPISMIIGGEAIAANQKFDVINPASGKPFVQAPECSQVQLDQAVDAAHRAFKKWRLDIEPRRKALLSCAETLIANIPEIAKLLTQEQGKPLAKATEELYGTALWFQYTAGLEVPIDIIQDDNQLRVEVHRRPIGVVGAITPWNYPVILAGWKIAPALLAGNTVVLKPSPFTPLSSLKLGEVFQQSLPPGVFNVVSGGNELGAWLTSHPTVGKISFTGSIATGKKVMIAGAEDFKRVTLELGGNDAAIVLGDCDPDKVAEQLFWGAFTNSGQVCSAIKRLYVDRKIILSIQNAIAEIAKRVKIGNGLEEGIELGPVNNAPQYQKVCKMVQDAKESGATVLAGGQALDNGGYFIQPTVLADVTEEMRIVAEEQFGPVLPIMPFSDPDDAIERANQSSFGLGGSVWSSDKDKAIEIASRLECGSAWVNQHLNILPTAPFGGFKHSGIGRENGPHGLNSFVELQTLNIAKE